MNRLINSILIGVMLITLSKISFAQFSVPVDSVINAGDINTNIVLNKTKKYLLNGVVKVNDGASLTIPAGTLIYGAPTQIIGGVPVIGGTLIVRRGGKIFANGTAQEPIVFTSANPVGQRAPGDWGGIVLLGKATNNQGLDVAIEGLTGEFHGGTDDADNSGVMRYVRIEFAGFELSPNNEINSLTMGSVGSGTTIEYIQCSYGLDDAFEWFGGTVNCKYLVAYKCKDDDFDTDFGFRGKVQFGISWKDPQIADQSRSEAFESDNDASGSTLTPRTAPIFSNITAIGPKRLISDVQTTNFDANFYYGVHQRRSSRQSIFNSVIMGYNQGGILLDGTNAMTDARDSVAKFRYNFVDGTSSGNTTGTVPSGFTFSTWFNQYNTNYTSALNQVNFKAPFNDGLPGLNPVTGSPLIGSANFSDPLLAGFDAVNYVGAMSSNPANNWDRGWTNYDPQNTSYGFNTLSGDWNATILIKNTANETRQVVLGRHPSATNGLDEALGEVSLPPVPPADVIDIRAELPSSTIYSLLDLRATGTVTSPISYKLHFQPGTANGILTWDPNLLGPGTWTMKQGSTVITNMKLNNKVDIENDLGGNSTVTIEVETQFSPAFSVASSWNIVSFPGLHPNSMSPDTLYRGRDINANLFEFNGSYQSATTVTPGRGYWLKMSANRAYTWNGTVQSGILYPKINSVPTRKFAAINGWNLIGGYEYPADVNYIRTIPSGRKSGQVFRYAPGIGYQVASIIDIGEGYWINLTGAADIIIPGQFVPTLNKSDEEIIKSDWAKIIITDAAGQSNTLYVSGNVEEFNEYNLPPLPPAGLFDVRFGTQRFVESLADSKILELNGIVYPVTITLNGLSAKLSDVVDGTIVNSIVKDGDKITISNESVNKIIINSISVIPTEFTLEQNYPNPFNPSTTIKFAIPDVANVTLSIYNILGQKVADLVNQTLQPGSYSFNWDASGIASGLYLYELKAGNYSSVKKMMLMK